MINPKLLIHIVRRMQAACVLSRRLIIALLASVLWLAASSTFADDTPTSVRPGDFGSIILPVRNDGNSSGPAEKVEVLIIGQPDFFHVDGSKKGPTKIEKGQTTFFTIKYSIKKESAEKVVASGAAVDFQVTVEVKVENQNTTFAPSDQQTVAFTLLPEVVMRKPSAGRDD